MKFDCNDPIQAKYECNEFYREYEPEADYD